MFEALLSGLLGVWTATIVGVGFLAVRFYLRERRGGGRVPAGRPVSPTEAVGTVGTSASGSGRDVEAVDSKGAATLPAGPFVVLPESRKGSRKRRRVRRRSARRRRPLVR